MLKKQKTGFIHHLFRVILYGLISAIALSWAAASITIGAQTTSTNPATVQDAEQVSLTSEVIEADTTPPITLDKLQSEKKRISLLPELPDDIKVKIDDIYNQAITYFQQAGELEKNKLENSNKRKNAPADLETAKEKLAKQTSFTAPEVSPDLTLTEAEQKLAEATIALEQSRKEAATLENEPKRRSDRRTKIPEESNSAKQKIEEIRIKLSSVPVEGQNPELVQANRILLEAQRRTLEATIEANSEELLFYDARRDVLAANRDLAARQLVNAEKRAEFWQQKVSELRKIQVQATQQEAIQAQRLASSSHPEVQKIVNSNVELAKEQSDLAIKIEQTTQYSNSILEQLTLIDKDFKDEKDKIEKAGGKINDFMGAVLLAKRNKLPDIQTNKRQIKSRLTEISQAQLASIKYDKEWLELIDTKQYAQNLLIEADVNSSDREIIIANLVEQLDNRRKILEAITGYYDNYSDVLINLDTRENSFIKVVEEYQDFIDKNILWVKSNTTLNFKNFSEAIAAFRWLVHPQNWKQTINTLWVDFKKVPFSYIAITLLFILSFILHQKMHASTAGLSKRVLNIDTDSFLHTIKVFVLTVLLAANWPIIILFLLWRLKLDASGSDFVQALTGGLRDLALGIFVFELLLHMTMPAGLMQDHFRVKPESLAFTRKHIRWFFSLLIPLAFIFRVLQKEQENNDLFNSTLGQLIFIVILIIVAVFLLKLLRPTGPLVEPYFKRNRNGWLERLRFIWYPMCLILPFIFSVLTIMGYFYAAWHLYEKLMYTLALIFMIFVFRAMLTRWLIVIRRKLSIIEKQKREAAATKPNIPQPNQSKLEKTIFEISQQANRLINSVIFILMAVGLWYVWQDVIPALSALGDFYLWDTTDAQGEYIEITLGLLVTALIISIMTVVVARNVPGLLEISVLRKLPIDAGVRFAITTVCRYIIVIVGVVLAFTEIGIGWSKVQWLVAAMTVGLGFGLQEIFANFISGLIILFEQPVRVDDVVTVGDVTGTVTKIKIRATTIRKWDQRELVVPNKEFITGHLINWTLSDKILRRDFIVGIAYGSDIAKAEKTLYEVAASNTLVLDIPKPVVLFKGFGDNSLEFELRVFIAGIENYIPVWHEVNCEIDNAFRKAGIEIAFPQRDIHIRSVKTDIPIDIEKMP